MGGQVSIEADSLRENTIPVGSEASTMSCATFDSIKERFLVKDAQTTVNLSIDGKKYTVSSDGKGGVPYVPVTQLSLADFIRDVAHRTGTKVSCREGGCGACIVTARIPDAGTGMERLCGVNSCLTPVLSCDGWSITTVQGLKQAGGQYHAISERLAKFHGSQCGFCSAGMVMSYNTLREQKAGSTVTMADAEAQLDGNLCRCTGYRPILDAFKSMTVDSSPQINQMAKQFGCCKSMTDVEDIGKSFVCVRQMPIPKSIYMPIAGADTEWFRPTNLADLGTILSTCERMKYRIVAGNTSTGVYKNEVNNSIKVWIDVKSVPELRKRSENPLSFGGAVSLSEFIASLRAAAKSNAQKYSYCDTVANHVAKIASPAIRDVGTLAGNLMMKHTHHDFPSDLFLLLETVGAQITIASKSGNETVSPEQFLKADMSGKVLLEITMPQLDSGSYFLRSFKIMPRYLFAHAFVNAGFLVKLDRKQNNKVIEMPRFVIGGINAEFIHASKTEAAVQGKELNNQATLTAALQALDQELKPDTTPTEASPEYRKNLARSLYYKFVLSVVGNAASSKVRSGAEDLVRSDVSTAKQDYETDKAQWPLTEPIVKLEAIAQCSGEAQYVNDIPANPGELHAAFVLTNVGNATLKRIDPSEALNVAGVVAYYGADDIPGANNAMPPSMIPEELFCGGKVLYAGQAVGMVVAESRWLAEQAAKLVKVEYENIQKPVLSIKDAMKKKLSSEEGKSGGTKIEFGNIAEAKLKASHVVKGEMNMGSQYHFSMETQTSIAIPTEDGMEIHSATQWVDHVQAAAGQVLGIPESSITIRVRRLGGGYGGKISRASFPACGCALAAKKLNRPVRMVMDLETNMEMIGKRLPYWIKYEVGTDDDGRFKSLELDLVCDNGSNDNETTSVYGSLFVQNCYDSTAWKLQPSFVNTNTPSHTYCRSPGSIQGIAAIETIVEHVAREVGKDPESVRLVNLMNKGGVFATDSCISGKFDPENLVRLDEENMIPKLFSQIKASADYDKRKKSIEEFNKQNRWRKKGMSLVPMRWGIHYFAKYKCFLAVYHDDGTVAVAHGGIEMGQGINTKVAQVVAKTLGVPLDMVKVKPTESFANANSLVTGGALTSEMTAWAAKISCDDLLARMKPVRDEMPNASWKELVQQCFIKGVDMTATHMNSSGDKIANYNIWGAALTEVEVDLLTGQNIVRRVDLIEDAGLSMSPAVDVGQVEGAFMHGLGMWTSERIKYDENTGQLLSKNTWEYKIPGARDIPENFQIVLLQNARNPLGVLQSKATGEPPACLAVGYLFAMRHALDSARQDTGEKPNTWYQMDGPLTVDEAYRLTLTSPSQFTLS